MRLLVGFQRSAFALVLLSIVGLCVAQASAGMLIVAGALAALSWYVTEGPWGRTLPRWVCNILILGACLNVVADLMQNRGDPLGVLGRFAMWLTLIKLYERRTARDHAQLLMLSLLLMIAGCLQSADFFFGVLLLVYACLGLYALMLYQLHASYERGKEARQQLSPTDYSLVPPLRPVLGPRCGLQFRTLVTVLGLGGIALSTLLFVIFPRSVGEGVMGQLPAPAALRRVGFAEEIDLLAGGRITDDRHQALTMRLLDAAGRPFGVEQPLLIRGAVLDRYDGHGLWTPSEGTTVHIETGVVPALLGTLEHEPVAGVTQEYDVHFATDVVFSLPTAVSIETASAAQIAYDVSTRTLRNIGPERLSGYTVRSARVLSPDEARAVVYGERQPWPRRGRFRNAQVAELARGLLTDAGLPVRPPGDREARYRWRRDVARTFTEYLQSERFAYTLDLGDVVTRMEDGQAVDPVVQFLFETRRGHCEYFASALTAMCHTVNVPARVASGFLAQTYDETTEAYNILASSAHAWAEVRTGAFEWTAFDPSPPAAMRDLHGIETNLADRLRWFYQRFEGGWSSSVVQFDQTAQRSLMESLNPGWSARLAETFESLRNSLQRINRAFYFGPAGYVWMGVVALALVIAIVALVKLMRRSRAIRRTAHLQHLRRSEYQRLLRQLGFYLDMLRALDRAGVGKPPWQPPLAHAATLEATRPTAAALVRDLSRVFYDVRYGGRCLTGDDLAGIRRQVEALPGALKRRRRE